MTNSYIKTILGDWGLAIKSNGAINKIIDETNGMPIVPETIFGHIPAALANARGKNSKGYLKELENAHRKFDINGRTIGWNEAAIAGSFISLGTEYHVATRRGANGQGNEGGIQNI